MMKPQMPKQCPKVIAYTRPDGGCSVVIPCMADWALEESLGDFILRRIARDVPARCPFSVLRREDLPQSRRFRNAWRHNFRAGTVTVDLPLAKALAVQQTHHLVRWMLSEMDPILRRLAEGHYGDLLFSLPFLVTADIADMDLDSLYEYRLPLPVPSPELLERLGRPIDSMLELMRDFTTGRAHPLDASEWEAVYGSGSVHTVQAAR